MSDPQIVVALIRTMTSRASMIFGSGTSSTRTSFVPHQHTAFMRASYISPSPFGRGWRLRRRVRAKEYIRTGIRQGEAPAEPLSFGRVAVGREANHGYGDCQRRRMRWFP